MNSKPSHNRSVTQGNYPHEHKSFIRNRSPQQRKNSEYDYQFLHSPEFTATKIDPPETENVATKYKDLVDLIKAIKTQILCKHMTQFQKPIASTGKHAKSARHSVLDPTVEFPESPSDEGTTKELSCDRASANFEEVATQNMQCSHPSGVKCKAKCFRPPRIQEF